MNILLVLKIATGLSALVTAAAAIIIAVGVVLGVLALEETRTNMKIRCFCIITLKI